MNIVHVFILVFALAVANSVAGVCAIRGFLARHATIADAGTLEEFKILVRRQMYQALLQMALLFSALGIGLYGMVMGRINLLLVIALNGVIIGLSKVFKRDEERARELEAGDARLAAEYRQVCEAWLEKPFPDF